MGKGTRTKSRRRSEDRRLIPEQDAGGRTAKRRLWGLIALVFVSAGVFASTRFLNFSEPIPLEAIQSSVAVEEGVDAKKKESSRRMEGSAPARSSRVLAYFGINDWRFIQLSDLKKGQEFQFENQFCYIDENGLVRLNPFVDVGRLPEADRYYYEGDDELRFPNSQDVVRFVGEDLSHVRHDRASDLRLNERFYFQGRLYEVVADKASSSGVSVRQTGTVLRHPDRPRSYDDEDVDPRTWRSIDLARSEEGGEKTEVSLLRPQWWLEAHKASEGASIHLDLSEMGVSGDFQVKAIDPLPTNRREEIPGTNRIIGKFSHENAQVIDLHLEGEREALGVTINHPIWSETHRKYLPAGEFCVGDEVKTLSGTSRVVKISKRPGRHTVYNLEIHKDHVYRVGESGILVHNKQIRSRKVQTGGREVPELEYWDFDGAERAYAAIRKTDDVAQISRHTGVSEFSVRRVKDHLFYRAHQLDDGVRRFDADPEIANAWRNLQNGNHTTKNIQLFEHELFESKFEGIFKTSYRVAHDAANRAGRPSGIE